MYKNLGKTVICSGYLKKANDGTFIECYAEDGDFWKPGDKISSACVMKNGKSIKDISFDGDGEIKTLYELVEKKFIGVCVGEKAIVTKELLFGDICENAYAEEFFYIGKQPTETIECYVVYFANNKKRYVPKIYCKLGGE